MESINSIMNNHFGQKSNPLSAKFNGFTQIPNSFLMRGKGDLDVYEKMILIILKKYMMKNRRCWPGMETLAERTPCSVSTVKRVIPSLEAKGLLFKLKEDGKRSNVYEIKL